MRIGGWHQMQGSSVVRVLVSGGRGRPSTEAIFSLGRPGRSNFSRTIAFCYGFPNFWTLIPFKRGAHGQPRAAQQQGKEEAKIQQAGQAEGRATALRRTGAGPQAPQGQRRVLSADRSFVSGPPRPREI